MRKKIEEGMKYLILIYILSHTKNQEIFIKKKEKEKRKSLAKYIEI